MGMEMGMADQGMCLRDLTPDVRTFESGYRSNINIKAVTVSSMLPFLF